jgi:hypothetical protein
MGFIGATFSELDQ